MMAVTLQQILSPQHILPLIRAIRGKTMTEQEWLTCTDPIKMLELGGQHDWQTPSKRKQVLFACAILGPKYESEIEKFEYITHALFSNTISVSFKRKGVIIYEIISNKTPAQVADIMREIVGNPFRPVTLPVKLPCADGPGCPEHGSSWLTPQVLTLAQITYDERNPDGILDPLTLAAVADSLEEAGCPNGICTTCNGVGKVRYCGRWMFSCAELNVPCECKDYKLCPDCPGKGFVDAGSLVAHLRLPGPHYRGCWVVDLILGKS